MAIVDATVVEAARGRISTTDAEAGLSVKVNVEGKMRATWGYQAFVNADEDNFIRKCLALPSFELGKCCAMHESPV